MSASPADWDNVFRNKRWGRWPSEHIVRQVAAIGKGTLRTLDIGCGPGAQLRYLAEEGHSPIGLDISGVGLERAKNWLHDLGYGVPLVRGNALVLPFASRTFDLVMDVETFVYISREQQEPLWREVARILKPGGQVVSVFFTPETDRSAFAESWTLSPLTSEDLVTVVEAANLRVIDQLVARRTAGPKHLLIEESVTRAVKHGW